MLYWLPVECQTTGTTRGITYKLSHQYRHYKRNNHVEEAPPLRAAGGAGGVVASVSVHAFVCVRLQLQAA